MRLHRYLFIYAIILLLLLLLFLDNLTLLSQGVVHINDEVILRCHRMSNSNGLLVLTKCKETILETIYGVSGCAWEFGSLAFASWCQEIPHFIQSPLGR